MNWQFENSFILLVQISFRSIPTHYFWNLEKRRPSRNGFIVRWNFCFPEFALKIFPCLLSFLKEIASGRFVKFLSQLENTYHSVVRLVVSVEATIGLTVAVVWHSIKGDIPVVVDRLCHLTVGVILESFRRHGQNWSNRELENQSSSHYSPLNHCRFYCLFIT